MTLPFTMQQDPVNGKYHVLIDGVAQSGYATVREGQLWEELEELRTLHGYRGQRVEFLEREVMRLQQEAADNPEDSIVTSWQGKPQDIKADLKRIAKEARSQ